MSGCKEEGGGEDKSNVGSAFFRAFTLRVIEYNKAHYENKLAQLKTADIIAKSHANKNMKCNACLYSSPYANYVDCACGKVKCKETWCKPDFEQCAKCGDKYMCPNCEATGQCDVSDCYDAYCKQCVPTCCFCYKVCCPEHNLTCPDCPNEICGLCKEHYCRKLKRKKTIVQEEEEEEDDDE